MGIRSRSWKRGQACVAIVELDPDHTYVCGKFTRDRSGRCDEHRPKERPRHARPQHQPQRRAS